MRPYNSQIEAEKGPLLRDHLKKMVDWYQQQHTSFNHIFQSELSMELADEKIFEMTKDYRDLSYNFSFEAILSPFCVSDFLAKHILSTYSYGPVTVDNHIYFPPNFRAVSWFEYKGNAPTIIELLQEYLIINNEGENLELGVLLEERDIRSGLTHAGTLELCMSIIRYYNVIRQMLIFMNSEYEKLLPEFVYPKSIVCDIQGLMEHFSFDDFQNRTTILITGSMHDIPKSYKAVLANLPWNIVIDFDPNSSKGGLRSAATTNMINDRYWDLSVVNAISIRSSITEWLKCGDFFLTTPDNRIKETFPNRTSLNIGNPRHYYRWMNQLFDKLFRQIANEQNPVSILFLNHDLDLLEGVIDKAEYYFDSVSYRLAAAYYWGKDRRQELVNHAYKDDIRLEIDYSDRLQIYPCNLMSFFLGLSQYYSYVNDTIADSAVNKLPGSDGESEIPINLQIRLAKYFDVLYTNCGHEEYTDALEKIQEFHSGKLVPWCAFNNNEVVNLISATEYDQWRNKIKTLLGKLHEGDKKIIHLVHRAGIGGTTMLRYLGWDFHKEYPVLVAQKYSRTEVRNVLQDLYDQQSKAFIVLADEDFDELDDLIQDIRVLSRPCVLIIAQRMSISAPRAQKLTFSAITTDAERKLKYKFKKISSLSDSDMAEKDNGYVDFIQTDASMKSPFFIGLYYLDKDFKHLPDYVNQAFKGIYRDEEYKALGYIAFSNIYSGVFLPKVFINKIMGINQNKSYLDNNPYAKSLLYISRVNGGTVSYQSKHILISHQMLNICSEHLFGDGYMNMLTKWSEMFIDDIIEELTIIFNDNYKSILERIFLRTGNANGESEEYSQLIKDISIPEHRVYILTKLANAAADIAKANDPEQTPTAYYMAAHCFGHLGRLYSKGGGFSVNFIKAIDCCEKALFYSEQCNSQDYNVYHMYGDVKRHALREKCQSILNYDAEISESDFKELEGEVEDTLRQYEISDQYGNHAYARSTSILLLIEYLEFVYKKRGIDNIDKMKLLNDKESDYKMRIENIFDSLDWEELTEKERNIFNAYHDRYESGIMYGDYSHMEVHHQNKLDYLIQHQGSSSEICMHRSRLVLAKIAKHKTVLPNGKTSFMGIEKKDIETILSLLEQSFEQNIDATNYRERRNRCTEYKRWIDLAKYSEKPIEKGIIYVKDWINLVERGSDYDPLPYYYLSVLNYLSALEGNKDGIIEAKHGSKRACSLANNRIESINRIKDILIEGKGMGQLRDISVFSNIGAMETFESIIPVVFTGIFEDVQSARGTVSLRAPAQWRSCKAKFTIRENNNLTKDFLTHSVHFYGGFSYESIVAINSSVRDITTNETLPSLKKVGYIKPAKDNRQQRRSIDGQLEITTDFIPKKIINLDNGGFIIQGTVFDNKPAGLHSRNLPECDAFYGDREFAEFILSLQKIKTSAKGPDNKGRYRIEFIDGEVDVDEMKQYGRFERLATKEKKKPDTIQKEPTVAEQQNEKLPSIINERVILFDIRQENKYITGKIEYNGEIFSGRITSNVTKKNTRIWKQRNRIPVKVVSGAQESYIVKPI